MQAELAVLLQALTAAGEAVLSVRSRGFTVKEKANADVLTEADLAADQILKNALLGAFPEDGWLSEETEDNAERLNKSRVWIVDPIDGTREFIEGIPEYAVSVALVQHGVPVLAGVYHPETKACFHAVKGEGAYRNGVRLHCRASAEPPYVLLASRSEFKRGEWVPFASQTVKVIGSIAYKLALVAAGEADATFSLGPKSEWDIAAGVLLVTEAGGYAGTCEGSPYVFNQANCRVKNIAACSEVFKTELLELLRG
ncbi:MAG TPA: 3'(2'),5'-bisphosphate nucleotidase CysQ [Gammaproteobacteria bacterium]|nr:3'(2'),5'-bisphosphate nucleotidase CysQ [Gammaproteobacteria bacterium]